MRWRSQPEDVSLRLYYASDIHGSDMLWRKFLKAGAFYDVGTLIMGGDLCGKGLAPVLRTNGGWTLPVAGEERHVSDEGELEQLETLVRQSGFYPRRMTVDEFDRLSDPAALEAMFEETLVESVRAWMELADERLRDSNVMAYVMPGNDDPWGVDEPLEGRAKVVACDEKVVRIGDHELLSLGWSNPTP